MPSKKFKQGLLRIFKVRDRVSPRLCPPLHVVIGYFTEASSTGSRTWLRSKLAGSCRGFTSAKVTA